MTGHPLDPVTPASILVVDDQPENLELLEDVLETEGYRVVLARDGEEALAEVERQLPDCIVLDVMMPRLDGFEVCRRLKSRRSTRTVPIIMLTALAEVEDKVRALDLGADDFLNKPVSLQELVNRVRSMVRIRSLRAQLDTSESIIVSLIEAQESQDPMARGHSQRVTLRALALGRAVGLPGSRLQVLAHAAILHDVGKIGVGQELLESDPGWTTEQQHEHRRHAELGEQILAPFASFAEVRRLVRHHHELDDGSGYPDGLGRDRLDLGTRVLALVNRHDHLRTRLGAAEAATELRRAAAAGQHDPGLVEKLLAILPEDGVAEELPAWQDLIPTVTDPVTGTVLVCCAVSATGDSVSQMLAKAGHRVLRATTAADAMALAGREAPGLALVDSRLPDTDGFELARRLKGVRGEALMPVVVLTTREALPPRSGISGVDDYLFLPVNRLELKARVSSLLRLHTYLEGLEDHHDVILSLAAALEAKDPYTQGHSQRVGALAARLGAALGHDGEICRLLQTAGKLHDIGKIGLPRAVLNKRGTLDAGELELVMRHPVLSERICSPLTTLQAMVPLIRHHHERFDGSGYPDGLAGEQIPLGARILGLADAFDALTSERPYRTVFSTAKALELLERETGLGRWDPELVQALRRLVAAPHGPGRPAGG